MKELVGTGMVEVYNHPLLWENRQQTAIYEAFTDIWGREALWVTIDRANLNFPNRPGHEQKGFIHWDYDPETKPQNVQGVLALADQTDPDMGGFQCVPWLYRNYDSWKLTQPENRDRFQPDMRGLEHELVKVALEAGDLLIFNSTLAHGIRPNKSKDKVRIAQYISMMPADESNQALIDWRVRSWRDRIAPEGYAFPGDPRKWEQIRYERAELSALGKNCSALIHGIYKSKLKPLNAAKTIDTHNGIHLRYWFRHSGRTVAKRAPGLPKRTFNRDCRKCA
jgi:Protein involved in biosynthesis of mitomycin antibiotics/polyketide fumonisin